jgi:hypothetical protein
MDVHGTGRSPKRITEALPVTGLFERLQWANVSDEWSPAGRVTVAVCRMLPAQINKSNKDQENVGEKSGGGR